MEMEMMYSGLLPFQSAKLAQNNGYLTRTSQCLTPSRIRNCITYTDSERQHEDGHSDIDGGCAGVKLLLQNR